MAMILKAWLAGVVLGASLMFGALQPEHVAYEANVPSPMCVTDSECARLYGE